MLHFLEIFPQIVIVLISEVQRGSYYKYNGFPIPQTPSGGLAVAICQALTCLKTILAVICSNRSAPTSNKAVYDVLEDTIK